VTIDDQELTAAENSDEYAVRIEVVRRPINVVESDVVVAEGPLEISVDGRSFALTMRTPGNDLELVAGFLFCEGCIEESEDIAAIQIVGENAVDVRFATGVSVDSERFLSAQRSRYASSACGVCSRATIDQLMERIEPLTPIDLVSWEIMKTLPMLMRPAQRAFAETGGIHAAALFDTNGEFIVLREDVGRHNAVDKVIGWSLNHEEVDLAEVILMVSGRIGFELVQKAAVARIPVIAAIGAPSSMAVELANSVGMQMYGFVSEHRCNQYSPVDA
jgi:FdhD protein